MKNCTHCVHAAAQQKEPVADIEALCLALHTAVDYDNARFYLMAEDGDDFVLDGHFTLEELRTIVRTIEKHPLQD